MGTVMDGGATERRAPYRGTALWLRVAALVAAGLSAAIMGGPFLLVGLLLGATWMAHKRKGDQT